MHALACCMEPICMQHLRMTGDKFISHMKFSMFWINTHIQNNYLTFLFSYNWNEGVCFFLFRLGRCYFVCICSQPPCFSVERFCCGVAGHAQQQENGWYGQHYFFQSVYPNPLLRNQLLCRIRGRMSVYDLFMRAKIKFRWPRLSPATHTFFLALAS